METQLIKVSGQDIEILAGNWPLVPDKPTLVFIHGAALSKTLWTAQVKGLAGAANTIAVDLPGRNGSTEDSSEKELDSDMIAAYAASVKVLVDYLKIQTPVLCGLSMGGAVVQSLLISHPETFKAAVLMNTGARLKVMPLIFESIQKDYTQHLDLVVDFAVSKMSDKQKIRNLMTTIAVTDPEIALKDFTACDRFDVMGKLERIKARVLLVAGQEDNITPVKYSEFLHQHIAGSELIVIDHAGHLSVLEKPDRVNQIIREFVLNAPLPT
jgi:pimeloyl-ACP methyl ester carboxylesterase